MFTNPKNILSEKEHGFTLIELIVVIIIVGVLAAVGISQYSSIVEKSRLAEARVRIGAMSKLAYEYYLNNGTFVGITNADVGVDNTCHPTDFYRYWVYPTPTESFTELIASRCSSGGKTPQGLGYQLDWRLWSNGALTEDYCMYSDSGQWVRVTNFSGCCR